MIKSGRLLNRRILPDDAASAAGSVPVSVPVTLVDASAADPATFELNGSGNLVSLGGEFFAYPGADPGVLNPDGLGAGIPAWEISAGSLVSNSNMDWGGDWQMVFVGMFPAWTGLPGGGTDDFTLLVSQQESLKRTFQVLLAQITDGGGLPTGAEIAIRAQNTSGTVAEIARRGLVMASVSDLSTQVLSFGLSHRTASNVLTVASRTTSDFYGSIDIGSYPRKVTLPGAEPSPIRLGHLTIRREALYGADLQAAVDAAATALGL